MVCGIIQCLIPKTLHARFHQNGTWVFIFKPFQYTGVYPGTCARTETADIIPFGKDIKYYTHDKTKKTNSKQTEEEQTWFTKVYHQEGLGLVKNWTLLTDTGRRRVLPLVFESSFTASQENQCCDNFERITYERIESDESIIDWFVVPPFCH